jgi:hypothetical protein
MPSHDLHSDGLGNHELTSTQNQKRPPSDISHVSEHDREPANAVCQEILSSTCNQSRTSPSHFDNSYPSNSFSDSRIRGAKSHESEVEGSSKDKQDQGGEVTEENAEESGLKTCQFIKHVKAKYDCVSGLSSDSPNNAGDENLDQIVEQNLPICNELIHGIAESQTIPLSSTSSKCAESPNSCDVNSEFRAVDVAHNTPVGNLRLPIMAGENFSPRARKVNEATPGVPNPSKLVVKSRDRDNMQNICKVTKDKSNSALNIHTKDSEKYETGSGQSRLHHQLGRLNHWIVMIVLVGLHKKSPLLS